MTESISPRRAILFILVITCVAYLNSFGGVFLFDDVHEVAANPHLELLFPPWEAMFRGNELPARPLPYLTFAIDRALWGIEPFGYHVTNLAIHLVAALALFDFTRTTLLSQRLRDRWGSHAVTLALVIAGLWAVHPLQTQAVTYVYQRIESMASMFILLSLGAFARATVGGQGRAWLAISFACCAAAMTCKEIAIVLPPFLLAYDWLFSPALTTATWLTDIRRRRIFHVGCFLTWIILAAVIISQSARYAEFGGVSRSPLTYAMTQPGVIMHYLRLAILPVGQNFEYSGWPTVTQFSPRQLPAYVGISAMVMLTAYGLVHRRPWAWLGVLFFGGLAPTSSIIPVDALVNEHRMYLPLAAVVAAVTLGVCELVSRYRLLVRVTAAERVRAGMLAAALAALVLTGLTRNRNDLYHSPAAFWNDVLEKDPRNFRALSQFAKMSDDRGDEKAAFELADNILELAPGYDIYGKLAAGRVALDDYAGAERRLRRGLERRRSLLDGNDPAILCSTGDLAILLRLRGKIDEADKLCSSSLADMREVLGMDHEVTLAAQQIVAESLSLRGDHAAAEAAARDALSLARGGKGPTSEAAINATISLARVLDAMGSTAEAEKITRKSINELLATGERQLAARLQLEDIRADFLEKEGLFEEAVAVRHRLADDQTRLHGRESPQASTALTKHAVAVAALATARGDHSRAETIYEKIHEHYQAHLGADHADTVAIEKKRRAAEERARHAAQQLSPPEH
jgi:tetratricopeptide (TPR) repeat protein